MQPKQSSCFIHRSKTHDMLMVTSNIIVYTPFKLPNKGLS